MARKKVAAVPPPPTTRQLRPRKVKKSVAEGAKKSNSKLSIKSGAKTNENTEERPKKGRKAAKQTDRVSADENSLHDLATMIKSVMDQSSRIESKVDTIIESQAVTQKEILEIKSEVRSVKESVSKLQLDQILKTSETTISADNSIEEIICDGGIDDDIKRNSQEEEILPDDETTAIEGSPPKAEPPSVSNEFGKAITILKNIVPTVVAPMDALVCKEPPVTSSSKNKSSDWSEVMGKVKFAEGTNLLRTPLMTGSSTLELFEEYVKSILTAARGLLPQDQAGNDLLGRFANEHGWKVEKCMFQCNMTDNNEPGFFRHVLSDVHITEMYKNGEYPRKRDLSVIIKLLKFVKEESEKGSNNHATLDMNFIIHSCNQNPNEPAMNCNGHAMPPLIGKEQSSFIELKTALLERREQGLSALEYKDISNVSSIRFMLSKQMANRVEDWTPGILNADKLQYGFHYSPVSWNFKKKKVYENHFTRCDSNLIFCCEDSLAQVLVHQDDIKYFAPVTYEK